MASVAIKIVGLTLIYFVGWYICEKLFKAIKDKFGNQKYQCRHAFCALPRGQSSLMAAMPAP